MSTGNSLWPNTTQVHPIPVIRPQIAWLQYKHENLFTRRKAYPEVSARRKLWFSRVNKSACVRTLPCYKCFIILNQQDREKNRSSSKSTSPKLFIWWRHRHNIVLKIRITLSIRLILCILWRELIPNVWNTIFVSITYIVVVIKQSLQSMYRHLLLEEDNSVNGRKLI